MQLAPFPQKRETEHVIEIGVGDQYSRDRTVARRAGARVQRGKRLNLGA